MNKIALKTYLVGCFVASAYDDLSYNKVANQSPEYPGSNTLYGALRAIDGKTSTCMRTDGIGLQSPYKSMWWKVDLGDVYNIYSVHILFLNVNEFENRQRGRFAGFSLYVSNTGDIQGSTLCYKDGQQLPPLNFTTVCIEYGRYVIFYNERLDGETYPDGYELSNVYTELCEVIVQGCTGFYGNKCDIKCPINCGNGTCHIQNGTCLTCKAGWTGGTCSIKCDKMWFGKNCSQQCTGHCRDSATCNHVTGRCDGGCDAGWTGNVCDKECSDGTYGFDCVNNCSGHCLNDSACDKHNGHCKNGCTPGYTYPLCNKHNLRNSSDDKDSSTSTIFLLISFTINIAFITCCFILMWGVYTRRVSILGFNPSCKKKSEQYADTDIKTEEDANYQELGPPREDILTTYQNTTLQ